MTVRMRVAVTVKVAVRMMKVLMMRRKRKDHQKRKRRKKRKRVKKKDDEEEEQKEKSPKKEGGIKLNIKKSALAKQSAKNRKNKGKKVKVPIVVDPRLALKLRPHQVVGVEKVYRCMMETKYAADNEYGQGFILGIYPCTHILKCFRDLI